jgi:hypothetical protein
MHVHQPGSQPIDIPETIPNPAVPQPVPVPSPAPKQPVKAPAHRMMPRLRAPITKRVQQYEARLVANNLACSWSRKQTTGGDRVMSALGH